MIRQQGGQVLPSAIDLSFHENKSKMIIFIILLIILTLEDVSAYSLISFLSPAKCIKNLHHVRRATEGLKGNSCPLYGRAIDDEMEAMGDGKKKKQKSKKKTSTKSNNKIGPGI